MPKIVIYMLSSAVLKTCHVLNCATLICRGFALGMSVVSLTHIYR